MLKTFISERCWEKWLSGITPEWMSRDKELFPCKVFNIYMGLGILFPFLCLSISSFKGSICWTKTYGNEIALLSGWSARNVKPSFFPNPPLLGVKPVWCVAYGLRGLDGGDGFYLVSDSQKKYVYLIYDCNKRLETGACLRLKEDIAFCLLAQEFIEPYKNNVSKLDILYEKDAFKKESFDITLNSIRNVRNEWSLKFNPEKDWESLRFYHDDRKSVPN